MDRGRKKKEEDKEMTGAKILMPEVFVSNYMKQQRNFLKYKREVRLAYHNSIRKQSYLRLSLRISIRYWPHLNR